LKIEKDGTQHTTEPVDVLTISATLNAIYGESVICTEKRFFTPSFVLNLMLLITNTTGEVDFSNGAWDYRLNCRKKIILRRDGGFSYDFWQ